MQTSGLGPPVFNYSSRYGSAGRLKSVMALNAKNYIQYGPSYHELMHTWGNFGIAAEGFRGGSPIKSFKPHWGFTGGKGTMETGKLNNALKSTAIFGKNKSHRSNINLTHSLKMHFNILGHQGRF